MEPQFWQDRWHKGEIGFHQAEPQAALLRHWPGLNIAKGSTVFVPLCGKSVDMLWLAEQGHRIVGAELSELAVDAYFAERGLTPGVRQSGGFTVKSSGVYELWCGDFFALATNDLPPIAATYDRAALVAMPPELQPRYSAKLAELTPAHAPALLIGLDYSPQEMEGPPFAVPQTRVRELMAPHFSVDVLEVRDGLATSEHLKKRGVTRLEEATYLLRRTA